MSLKNYLRKSILVGVKMIENYAIPYFKAILKADQDKDKPMRKLWDDDVKKIESYIISYGENAEKECIYNFGITSDCEYGRLYTDRGFGQLWSSVKNTVSHEHYIDIDMVNSQATIMWQMVKKDLGMNEEFLPQFKKYITFRNQYLKEVMDHYDVSKRLAKLLFTSLMNGGSVYGWKQKNEIKRSDDIAELDQFEKEVVQIVEAFFGKRPDIYSQVMADSDFQEVENNIKSKIFSRVIKNIEALCLEKLYIRCGRPKYGSLEHDGMRIKRNLFIEAEGGQLNTVDVLNGTAEDIKNDRDLGYEVEFIIKEPTKFLDMADLSEVDGFDIFNGDYFEQLITYEDKKRYFEVFHFKTMTPTPKYNHLCWVEQYYTTLEIHEWTKTHIIEAHENRYFTEMVTTVKKATNKNKIFQPEIKTTKPEKVLFTDRWIKDKNIRTYNRIDFIPYNKISSRLNYWDGKNDKVAFNSFLGYSMKCNTPIPENSDKLLKIWTDLVFELCGANERFYNLYVNALADKIQFPNKKSKAGCFIFKSPQGAGKNMSLVPFEVILGEYYISSSEERDFWGTHADAFYRKIIINLNEMQMNKDGIECEGKIKAFISEEWMTMNQKFKNLRKVRNTALPIFYTNKQKPFSIDFKSGDRRLNVAESTNKYIELSKSRDKDAFWGEMNTIFRSDKFIATFYDFLNKRDLSNVDWSQVKTDAYMEMAFQYHTSDILFICDWVEKTINFHTAMNTALSREDPFPTRFNISTVFEKYREFCNEFNIKPEHTLPQHKFMANLTDLKIGITSKKSSVMVFDMDLENVKKILIEKQYLKIDIDDEEPAYANDRNKEEPKKDSTTLCDMYGLDISEFI